MRKLRACLLGLTGAGMMAGAAFAQSSLGGADNANVTAIPPPPPMVAAPAAPPPASVPAQPVPPGLVQSPVPPVDTDSNVDNGANTDNANTSTPPGAPPPGAAATMPMSNDWVPGKTAEIGVLDKVDGGIANLNVPVGGQVVSGDLQISVLACVMRPGNEIPDAAIFLNVQSTADKTATPIFHGWMVRSIPAAAVVGDGSETLRVANCT